MNSRYQETKALNFYNLTTLILILNMSETVEERFAKVSLGTDGKRNGDLTRIILPTVYPKPEKTKRVR